MLQAKGLPANGCLCALACPLAQAWRGWLLGHVKPKLAQLSQSSAHFFLGAQRRAWAGWREYVSHRRHRTLLKASRSWGSPLPLVHHPPFVCAMT